MEPKTDLVVEADRIGAETEERRLRRLRDMIAIKATAEEALAVLTREGLTGRHLETPDEVWGRMSEVKVLDYLRQIPMVAEARITKPGSTDDEQLRDIVIVPISRLRLSLLSEFYIQVKSSSKRASEPREEIKARLRKREWVKSMARHTTPEVLEQKLEAEVDLEILKMKLVIIVAGDEVAMGSQFQRGVNALYSYWQQRSAAKVEKEREVKKRGLGRAV